MKEQIYLYASTNESRWEIWKKIDTRWHVYISGHGWIRSTISKSAKNLLIPIENVL